MAWGYETKLSLILSCVNNTSLLNKIRLPMNHEFTTAPCSFRRTTIDVQRINVIYLLHISVRKETVDISI